MPETRVEFSPTLLQMIGNSVGHICGHVAHIVHDGDSDAAEVEWDRMPHATQFFDGYPTQRDVLKYLRAIGQWIAKTCDEKLERTNGKS